MVANLDIEAILNGPDYFRCEMFRTRMPKRDCVKRQKRDHKVYSIYLVTTDVDMSLDKCQECKQGKGLMKEFEAGTIQMYSPVAKSKQRGRGRRGKDFQAALDEFGFSDDREMFQCLLKDLTQGEVADLIGCARYTVQLRAAKYGIPAGRRGRRWKRK